MRSILSVITTAAAAAAAACTAAGPDGAHTSASDDGGTLIVLIAVDQLRGDYLDRFSDHLVGGLAFFRDEGAFFPNARQHHAVTSTAPGHAALLSGRYPASTGIVSNDSGVPDPARGIIGATDAEGASPHRFRGTTLVDWLRAHDPGSRVLAVARKDRGAILPVGRAPGDVYWWANGRFTTSSYYADALPAWLRAANARIRGEDFAGRAWTLLLPDSAYPERDDAWFEGNGRSGTFPHRLPDGRWEALAQLEHFPWADSLTLDVALAGTHALRLGRRGSTDVLVLGLSTLDEIGHDFGPDSREVRDHMYRLDRWLGAFLDSLHSAVPRERTLLVLAADHGVSSMPEYTTAAGLGEAGRVDTNPVLHAARQPLRMRFGASFGFDTNHGLFLADVAALRAHGVDVDSLSDSIAAQLRELPGVRRVLTPATLAAAPADDEDALLWRRSIPEHIGWLAIAVPEPNFSISRRTRAEHGHLQPENMSIAVAFAGAGIQPGRHATRIAAVDIAPTLAALLGITPLEPTDGRALAEIVP
jgi:hypothetical protein